LIFTDEHHQYMKLFIALRLLSEQHAKAGIEAIGPDGRLRGELIDSNITRRFPALKNIALHLASTGKLPESREGNVLQQQNGKRVIDRMAAFHVFWCELETALPVDYWRAQKEVEVIIQREDFEIFTATIRHRGGAAYIEACENYADALEVCLHPDIGYVPPRNSSPRAA
jgi:hypothetical protein